MASMYGLFLRVSVGRGRVRWVRLFRKQQYPRAEAQRVFSKLVVALRARGKTVNVRTVKPFEDLLILITAHPGLNSEQLQDAGWRYKKHGSLRDAEHAGVIQWCDGWRVVA